MSQSLLDGMSMSHCLTAGALPAQHSLSQCRLLQNAANSVLGQEIITYAKHLGIKTINVVRQNEYINELKQKGCCPCLPSHLTTQAIVHPFWTAYMAAAGSTIALFGSVSIVDAVIRASKTIAIRLSSRWVRLQG